ncbi:MULTISPECIES: hypothetical protein [Pseudoalteromonas]|uniref:hypothetical protein n=1 Tax=Pseudoalteromonas TaxID=53246 RepID=UPI00110B1B47|nr:MULTISPECIES: hypothetical protein [Pseudoalteromonas]MCG7545377.1 hypothetical protein [Pseudoalteromonas sp. MM17-2]TMO87656.1 hypothetical protein CWC12_10270 [Pseudoalteromonas ruthenica]TMP22267.1 hypothetical protein CWC06_15740 [Pseudoalteromonas ruthenica]
MPEFFESEIALIKSFVGVLTSEEIAKRLERGQSASQIRRYCAKNNISLKKETHSKANIKLALELRSVGFTREVIKQETGLPRSTQAFYENKQASNND